MGRSQVLVVRSLVLLWTYLEQPAGLECVERLVLAVVCLVLQGLVLEHAGPERHEVAGRQHHLLRRRVVATARHPVVLPLACSPQHPHVTTKTTSQLATKISSHTGGVVHRVQVDLESGCGLTFRVAPQQSVHRHDPSVGGVGIALGHWGLPLYTALARKHGVRRALQSTNTNTNMGIRSDKHTRK